VVATSVLLLACPDRPGIVAAVSGLLAGEGAMILDAQQHSDEVDGRFYQRIAFDCPAGRLAPLTAGLTQLAPRLELTWSMRPLGVRHRAVVLVSRPAHAMADILVRAATGDLLVEVAAVISDRPDHAPLVGSLGVPYEYLPIGEPQVGEPQAGEPQAGEPRSAQERQLSAALDRLAPDLVILARYMRVLPGWLVERWQGRMINIHHSFLPAFIGADPYRQAHDRGVKVIGATAHYVTEELDEGPIIEQDVVAVTHRDSPAMLARRGRDLESVVLARAVRAHLEHRVLISGPRTIVFA